MIRLSPFAAALAVVLIGRAELTDQGTRPGQWGYRVQGSPPVVVWTRPDFDGYVMGTVEPGSFVAAFEGQATDYVHEGAETAVFQHVGGADWNGWVLASELTELFWVAEGHADEFRRNGRLQAHWCVERPSDCIP